MADSVDQIASEQAEELGTSVVEVKKHLEETIDALKGNMSTVLQEMNVRKLQCVQQYANETLVMNETRPEGFCPASFDRVSCWPPTPFNTTAVIRCFKQFYDVFYDDTRKCFFELLGSFEPDTCVLVYCALHEIEY